MLSALRPVVLVLLTLAVCAAQAAAFGAGGSAGTAQLSTPAGCRIHFGFDAAAGVAAIMTGGASAREAAGGSSFADHSPDWGQPPMTAATLLACGYSEVTIRRQNGAEGDFAEDDYLGIRFTAREAAAGPVYRYEWAFAGVGQTNLIRSRTQVKAASPGAAVAPAPRPERPATGRWQWRGLAAIPVAGRFVLLAAGLAGLVALILGADFGFRLLRGFVQHRRACRIEAVLEIPEARFDGVLTVIGLNGCRFQPANKTTERQLLAQLRKDTFSHFDVMIGGTPHPVFVDGFHGYYSALFFYQPITRAELRKLLAMSKIPPYLVPHIGHKTTRGQWRSDIARRKAALAAGKELQCRQPDAAG